MTVEIFSEKHWRPRFTGHLSLVIPREIECWHGMHFAIFNESNMFHHISCNLIVSCNLWRFIILSLFFLISKFFEFFLFIEFYLFICDYDTIIRLIYQLNQCYYFKFFSTVISFLLFVDLSVFIFLIYIYIYSRIHIFVFF